MLTGGKWSGSPQPALPCASQSTLGSGRRAAPRELRAAVPTPLPTSPCVPAGSAPATRGSPRTQPHSGATDAALCRLRPGPPGSPQRGRAWIGAAVAAGDATALTLHAPLPASVSLPSTRMRPDLGRPRSPSSRPRGPTCAVARTGDQSAPGTPSLHRAAGCAPDGGDSGDCGRGGGGKRAGGRVEGWLLPPAQDRRFLSSLGPLARARRPSRLPDRSAQKVLLFTWRKPRRGSVMGQGGQGPKDWALPRPWE